VVTGPDGTYALDALAPGAYIVSPMLGGGGGRPKDIYTKKVEVTLGARAKVDIDTTPGPTTLSVSVNTDNSKPIPMAGIVVIQAAFEPTSVDEMRDYTLLHKRAETIPIYMRSAFGGGVEIAGVRPGAHTACAVFGDPMGEGAAQTKFKCTQVKVGGAGKQAVTITVPAAWFEDAK
ncbi:MAG TPA: hypothetical protein VK427_18645, partial [Kofleriaceae bacterium]|nr:hypothetical protein [Kofleriaceae bacterium]